MAAGAAFCSFIVVEMRGTIGPNGQQHISVIMWSIRGFILVKEVKFRDSFETIGSSHAV